MDFLVIAFFTGMALVACIGSYSAGFCRGWDAAEDKHRWSRWFIRQTTNRSERL